MFEPDTYDGESWTPVTGYEGVYQVSNIGRVWSIYRVARRPSLPGFNKGNRRFVHHVGGNEMQVKIHKTKGRYFCAQTGMKGSTVRIWIDELIAETFGQLQK